MNISQDETISPLERTRSAGGGGRTFRSSAFLMATGAKLFPPIEIAMFKNRRPFATKFGGSSNKNKNADHPANNNINNNDKNVNKKPPPAAFHPFAARDMTPATAQAILSTRTVEGTTSSKNRPGPAVTGSSGRSIASSITFTERGDVDEEELLHNDDIMVSSTSAAAAVRCPQRHSITLDKMPLDCKPCVPQRQDSFRKLHCNNEESGCSVVSGQDHKCEDNSRTVPSSPTAAIPSSTKAAAASATDHKNGKTTTTSPGGSSPRSRYPPVARASFDSPPTKPRRSWSFESGSVNQQDETTLTKASRKKTHLFANKSEELQPSTQKDGTNLPPLPFSTGILSLQQQQYQSLCLKHKNQNNKNNNDKERLLLSRHAAAFYAIVPVKDCKHGMRHHKECFVGSEAVDAMMEARLAATRPLAAALGQQFMTRLLLFQQVNHVNYSTNNNSYPQQEVNCFLDSKNSLYRFLVVRESSDKDPTTICSDNNNTHTNNTSIITNWPWFSLRKTRTRQESDPLE